MLPLEVLAVVPLDDGVFQLTDPIGVAEYLENTVSDSSLLAVVTISQHIVLSWLS